MREHCSIRINAQNGCSGMPPGLLSAQNGRSGVPPRPLCAQNGRSGVLSRPPNAQNGCSKGALEATVRPKWLIRRAFESTVRTKALKMAARARLQSAACPKSPLKITIRSKCSELQVPITLSSIPLCSAPPCPVHKYARVHTSIYIYIWGIYRECIGNI